MMEIDLRQFPLLAVVDVSYSKNVRFCSPIEDVRARSAFDPNRHFARASCCSSEARFRPYQRQALLQRVPMPEPGRGVPDIGLGDAMPNPANISQGCRFNPRCRTAVERCRCSAQARMVREPQGMIGCYLA
jgi:oligopeptide/dipeptide ABC transporter ATP-binding protein